MSVFKALLFLTQFTIIFAALPPIKKCQLSDSNCIKSSAQPVVPLLTAGIPELSSEVLDPMHVDHIKVDLSGLKLDIKEVEIKGLKNSVIDNLSFDMAKKKIQLIFHADLTLKGKYTASGKLIILPISGAGETVMKIKNTQLVIDAPFEIIKNKDGKDIINLKSYKYKFDVRDGAQFRLANLFNGNKALSDPLHEFMNSNWKTMLLEFGVPVFDQPVQKVFNSIKTYLKSQPIEDITKV